MKISNHQQGSHHILAPIIIAVLVTVGLVGYRVFSKNNANAPASVGKSSNETQNNSQIGSFKFTRLPFDVENVGSVTPVGEFAGINRQTAQNSHFAGNYRHYIFSKEPGKRDYNVYAPADSKITAFRYSDMTKQYRFDFAIGDKGAFFFLDHVQSLSPDIETKLKQAFGGQIPSSGGTEQVNSPVEVKAGEVLGKTGLQGIAWDWGLVDPSQCDGILKKDHYKQDMCALSVYDYLPAELQAKVKPLAGYWSDPSKGGSGLKKVVNGPSLGDYGHDKEGTLSGAWFQKPGSWENAFFTPDPYLENGIQVRLAIPELSVFGVFTGLKIGDSKTNPDPRNVTPDSGIVSYLLASENSRDTTEHGVLLVKVNSDQTITLEAIPNIETPPSKLSFSAKAVTIKR